MGQRNFKLSQLRQVTTAARHKVGTYWEDPITGNGYRYAYAGGTLSAGHLAVAAAINAAHMNQAIAAAVAIGEDVLELTVTAGVAIAENALRNGFLQINDGTGEGHSYRIEGNSAISAAETDIIITLDANDPIKVALVAGSEFTLVHNPYYAPTLSTTISLPCGVALCAVASGSYCWLQTKGAGIVRTEEATTAGHHVEQSAVTAGAVDTVDTNATESHIIGTIWGTAGVQHEYKPIWLTID